MKKFVLIVPVVVICIVAAAGYFLSTRPTISFEPAPSVVGEATPVNVRVANNHGIRRLTAEIEHNGRRHKVHEAVQPARHGFLFRDSEPLQTLALTVGKKQVPELQDGPARLIVEAVSNDFAGKAASVSTQVQV